MFYVWFDAPIGYLSITSNYTSAWKEWWQNPEQVTLVQFMGKDNVPFHTVIFPATLIGTKRKWTMLHHISVTDYLNYEDGKFSKSRGVGVFGNDAKDTGIATEVWRYYLLVNRPENADTVFSWDDFAAKNNHELLANLGNFVHRTITFLCNHFEGRVPMEYDELMELDRQYVQQVDEELHNYLQTMEKVSLKNGLRIAMSISRLGNVYLQVCSRKHMCVFVCVSRREMRGVMIIIGNGTLEVDSRATETSGDGIVGCSKYLSSIGSPIGAIYGIGVFSKDIFTVEYSTQR